MRNACASWLNVTCSTPAARARELLDNWSEALTHFVKVMPTDYARALKDMKSTRTIIAAE